MQQKILSSVNYVKVVNKFEDLSNSLIILKKVAEVSFITILNSIVFKIGTENVTE